MKVIKKISVKKSHNTKFQFESYEAEYPPVERNINSSTILLLSHYNINFFSKISEISIVRKL